MYAVMTVMNIITLKTFAPFIPYGENMLWAIRTMAVSFLCAGAVKYGLAFYQGNVFAEIFLKGSAFVLINLAALSLTGDLSYLKQAAGIKWKLR